LRLGTKSMQLLDIKICARFSDRNLVVNYISTYSVHPSKDDGKLFYTCSDALAKNISLIQILLCKPFIYLGCLEIPYRYVSILIVI